jgi:hypothetical protein
MEWREASVVNGSNQQYSAQTAIIALSEGEQLERTFTYADLILTDLNPGELLVQVQSLCGV